jgi:hypothetical protein
LIRQPQSQFKARRHSTYFGLSVLGQIAVSFPYQGEIVVYERGHAILGGARRALMIPL